MSVDDSLSGREAGEIHALCDALIASEGRCQPNVASVLHLGRSGGTYFYAMEFVEGETLDALLKRRGPLEVTLALEIARQVGTGLAAVHKQNLVHRDVKPANVMVNLEENGEVSAKLIDLGLAKAVQEPDNQTAISTPGAFAGTPEFASPEGVKGPEAELRRASREFGAIAWR